MGGDVLCPTCGTEYVGISRHWAGSSDCSHPEYDDKHHELIRGILLSAGSIETDGKRPALRVSTQNHELLKWLDSEFGRQFSRGVHKTMTSEEVRTTYENRGWTVPDNPDPMYEWGLRTHPGLDRYARRWYEQESESGTRQRRVPAHVERSPETLRVWYLFAGRVTQRREKGRVVFPFTAMNADSETIRNLLKPFNPRLYTDMQARDSEKRQDFHLRNSQAFFEYIGDPPTPSVAEKWPDESLPLQDDETKGDVCPSCGRRYTYLSGHWDGDECEFPSLSDRQHAVLSALLISGATLNQTGENKRPHLLLDSTSLIFLDWARDILGPLCARVTERNDAEASRARLTEWLGESGDANGVYRLQTRSHPFFTDAGEWADRRGNPDQSLELPDSLDRTVPLLKAIYLHRGTYARYTQQNIPVIRVQRMPTNEEDLLSLFEPFEPRFTDLSTNHRVMVLGEADDFFEYIGEPPLGLEDLWPE